jgi:hypothetical protein
MGPLMKNVKKTATLKKLIKEIKEGGFVIAPRRFGKTVASLCVLEQDKDFILSCYSIRTAEWLRKDHPTIKDQIYGPECKNLEGTNKKIIVDEFFWHKYAFELLNNKRFWTAVSSIPHRITVANGKRWLTLNNK